MRATAIVAMVILAAVGVSGPLLAAGTSGKVMAIEGEKVVIQLEEGVGKSYPVGTRGIDIKGDAGASVRARVVAASGDKITFRVMRGKASSLTVGASVALERAQRTGSEEMQGC